MTRDTPSSDILAILLIQSDYDPDNTLKQAILNVEKYEKTYNRYFITYEGEFRFMFYYLALSRGLITFDDIYDSSGKANDPYYSLEFFENITILDWIGILLKYEVYESNDSDQMWCERGKEGWFHVNGKHHLLDEKTQNAKVYPYLCEGVSPTEDSGYQMRDFVREHLGSTERIKESALFDCQLRKFFENPDNINRNLIADFFKKNLKMDILTAWSHSHFQLPTDYMKLAGIPSYIITSLNPEIPFETEIYNRYPNMSDKIVFFLIDGLGHDHLYDYCRDRKDLEIIQQIGVSNSLNCQFPSTTASNMTTIHTGQEVAQHGILDWQYYEPLVDDIITPLPFSFVRDKEGETLKNKVNPTDIYPQETFYQKLTESGIKSRVFQRNIYNDSTYSRALLKGADMTGYDSLDSGLHKLAECIKNDEGKHYYLFYYDRIDLISHKYGPGSEEFNLEMEYLLENLNKLRLLFKDNKLNSEDVLFILSSDHGHIQDTGNNIYLNVEFPEITDYIKRSEDGKLLAPAGSPRAMFLYIKDEKVDEVLILLQEKLCQKAVVLKTEELLEDNEFNKENSPFRTYSNKISSEFREKLGNIIILPVQNEEGNWTVWWYEEGVYEVENNGHHGGLSRYEMLVPFYAWRLGDWVK